MSSIVKDVWQGRDNDFVLLLEAVDPDGVKLPSDLAAVSSAMLEFEDSISITVNKNDADPAFSWWDGDLSTGEIRFTLGADVTAVDEDNYPMRLTLFSPGEPNGIVWTSFARNEFSISVYET